jgi:hypothetical protein
MGLTVGADPFGPSRTGRFDFPAPAEVVYTRPLGRRVRGVVAGRVMIDTEEAHLVWRTGSLPTYAFPRDLGERATGAHHATRER